MAAQYQQPIVSPHTPVPSRPDPQTPVANMVESRIKALMREKALLINELADAKLRREGVERKFNESQAKFKELEDVLERLKTENEKANSLNVRSCSLAAELTLIFILDISKGLGYGTRN